MKIYIKRLAYIQVIIYICTEQQTQYKQFTPTENRNRHKTQSKMKKNLSTLAKELDFKESIEYFEYMIDSHINGNFTQCKELFNAMKKDDKKAFLNYLNGQAQFNGHLEIRNFYFNLL